jgi:hypothetical protein
MNVQIVSWNVRGLNDGAKRTCIRNLLHSWKADIFCLQETKLESVSWGLTHSLWCFRYVNWLWAVDWVMPCKVIQLWAAWQIRSADLRNMAILRMVPHCVIWCLWRERNARLFEDCESSMVDIKLLFFQTLYAWVNSVGVSSINSITELIDHCCF